MKKRSSAAPSDQGRRQAKPIGRWTARLGRLNGRFGLLAALAAAALPLLFLWGISADPGPPDAPTASVLTVEAIQARLMPGYPRRRSFLGRIEAARSSRLGFELGGLVRRILVDEGQRVRQGQPLALLDTQRLHSRLQELAAERDRQAALLLELEKGPRREDIARARAAVRQWEARLELAESTRRRSREAYQLDAIAGLEWDQARLNRAAVAQQLEAARQELAELENGTRPERLEAQRASLRLLEAQIESLQLDIRKSALHAPFDAAVAERLVDEGEVVAAGQGILHLLEDGRLEARVGVAADEAHRLSPGLPVQLQAAGRTLPAQVKAVLPDRQTRTRTVEALLSLDDPQGLRHGDLVEWTIEETVPESGFWLPLCALTESVRGLWAAYVLIPQGRTPGTYRLQRRELEVLVSETDRAYVRGSLQDGELVAASGVHRLVPGQTVQSRSHAKAQSRKDQKDIS